MTDGARELDEDFAAHRPALLRHCYRMLGSYADAEDLVQDALLSAWKSRDSYSGAAPLGHWLMRIATHACLNELGRRKRRGLPQLDRAAGRPDQPLVESDAAEWVTPAPDAGLFSPPMDVLEARESVALAFIALLQRLPPRQRAVLLLKDVVGWPSDEIAAALDTTVASVSAALHRARASISAPDPTREARLRPVHPEPSGPEPAPEVLRAYIRSWEEHDVDALVSLLRDDVVFAMPPHATWFRGARDVESFLRGPRFSAHWSAGFRIVPTRANGQLALVFYRRRAAGGTLLPSSIQLVAFREGRVAECVAFIGASLRGFDVPESLLAE